MKKRVETLRLNTKENIHGAGAGGMTELSTEERLRIT